LVVSFVAPDFSSYANVGVVTQVNVIETVCASGAVPPADGKIGCTVKLKVLPGSVSRITAKGVFGDDSA
jgi:hypothetical protein